MTHKCIKGASHFLRLSFILAGVVLFAETALSDLFKTPVVTIDELKKEGVFPHDTFLNETLKASDIPAADIPKYKKRLVTVFDTIAADLKTKPPASGEEKAQRIFAALHDQLLKKYKFTAYSFAGLLDEGLYNCVNSAILFNLALNRFDIDTVGVIVKFHTFSRLRVNGRTIDVETTNRYGFDPDKKKTLYDKFGKAAGVVMVPKSNYGNQREVSNRDMLAVLLTNISVNRIKEGRLRRAVVLNVAAWQISPHLPIVRNNTEHALVTLIKSITALSQYERALKIPAAMKTAAFPEKITDRLTSFVYSHWTADRIKAKKYDDAINIGLKALAVLPKSDVIWANVEAATINYAQDLARAGSFEKAYRLMTAYGKYPRARQTLLTDVTTNVVFLEADARMKEKQFKSALKRIDGFRQKWPDNTYLPQKHLQVVQRYAFHLAETDPAGADAMIQKKIADAKHPDEKKKLKRVRASVFLHVADALYKKEKTEAAIAILETGLSDADLKKKLTNNYIFYIERLVRHLFEQKKEMDALRVLKRGHPFLKDNEAYSGLLEMVFNNYAVRLIQKGQKKEAFLIIREGLRWVPKSRTLKSNLRQIQR